MVNSKQNTTDKQSTLKLTISGSFHTSNKEIESFDHVTGVMPALDEDKVTQMVIRRYAPIWVQHSKADPENPNSLPKYKAVRRIRNVYIDSIDANEDKRELSYIGKNILDMNFEEIQDLAAANDLSAVPLYKSGSLTHARRVAWSEYAVKILKRVEYVDPKAKLLQNIYDFRTTGFNPHRFEPIIADGKIRRSSVVGAPIEETIDLQSPAVAAKAQASGSEPSRLTLPQLKAIADAKGIEYHQGVGFNQLYEKVYGQKAA